jgi:hemolysin activation/secretion protein
MWLLAQLVAPPLQPGPIRLPESSPLEQRSPLNRQPTDTAPVLQPQQDAAPLPQAEPAQAGPEQEASAIPPIEGTTPYSAAELQTILRGCLQPTNSSAEGLNRCAAVLTTKLVSDGYVNSRVYVKTSPAPARLEVVLGQLAELRIQSQDAALERRIRSRLKPLVGKTLNMTRLERELVDLRRLPGVGDIKGNMGRLGTDVSQAVLNLTVQAAPSPWQGDFSIRNDGNAGSGEWRALGITLKNDLITLGDTLLVVGELNADQQAELGATISSVSYTAPLTEKLKLTGSFGYSRRNLVEAEGALRHLTTRQFQGYGQLEWVFKDSSRERWSAFAGISGNRNDTYLSGQHFSSTGPGGWNQTGYTRMGINYGANQGRLSWNAGIYGLQGLSLIHI